MKKMILIILGLSLIHLTGCATVGAGLQGFSNGWNQSYRPQAQVQAPNMCTVNDYGTFKNVQCY